MNFEGFDAREGLWRVLGGQFELILSPIGVQVGLGVRKDSPKGGPRGLEVQLGGRFGGPGVSPVRPAPKTLPNTLYRYMCIYLFVCLLI